MKFNNKQTGSGLVVILIVVALIAAGAVYMMNQSEEDELRIAPLDAVEQAEGIKNTIDARDAAIQKELEDSLTQ